MSDQAGPVINLYNPSRSEIALESGNRVGLVQKTDYPENGNVLITLEVEQPESFTLSLRIPAWSEQTTLRINGQPTPESCTPGSYVRLTRNWKNGDTVEISFDFRTRVITAPSGVSDKALVRGPIVLAFDSRLVPYIPYGFTPPLYRYQYAKSAQFLDVKPVSDESHPEIWMTFDVPFVDEAGQAHTHRLCDFSSAGNAWTKGNVLRVWMPQPFDYRHNYIENANWLLDVGGHLINHEARPQVPELYRNLGMEDAASE
jgi:hypothetical protein